MTGVVPRAGRPSALVSGLLDAAYIATGAAAAPIAVLRGRLPRLGDHLRRRAFDPPPERAGSARCLWIHGVSVGEVLSARGLVGKLETALPGWDLAISSSTSAGVAAARLHYSAHLVFSAPLDLSFLVRRALARLRPDALVVVEHDLWPNLLRHARSRGMPIALVNARMSPRSFAGYRRLSRFYTWPPRDLDLVCVEDEASASRFRALGFDGERLQVSGSLKFDNPAPPPSSLRAEMGFRPGDWVLVAGSTHEGEEDAVLEAFLEVRRSGGGAFLILAPRRIERIGAIARDIALRGLSHRLWSESRERGPDVILVDTVGELAEITSAGDAVFIGGSLVPVGGHNVIEPASHSRPVVIGPYHRNFESIVATFLEEEALVVVRDARELAARLLELRRHPDCAREIGARAGRTVERHRGAGERTVAAVLRMLGLAASPVPPLQRAE